MSVATLTDAKHGREVELAKAMAMKIQEFKAPEEWVPVDMHQYEAGLALVEGDYPFADPCYEYEGSELATKEELKAACSEQTLPHPGFLASLSAGPAMIKALEFEFGIKPKYGYWVQLPTKSCNPTGQFSDSNGN